MNHLNDAVTTATDIFGQMCHSTKEEQSLYEDMLQRNSTSLDVDIFNELETDSKRKRKTSEGTALLPCPFCLDGGSPYMSVGYFQKVYVDKDESEDWVMQKSYQIKCNNCLTTGPNWFKTEQDAVNAWNTRFKDSCEMLKVYLYDECVEGIECSECGWCEIHDWDETFPAHCPRCGKRVMS